MRRYELDFKLCILLWVFILLSDTTDFIRTIASSGGVLAPLTIIFGGLRLSLEIALFVSILKQNRKLILIFLGGLLTIDSVDFVIAGAGVGSLLLGIINGSYIADDFMIAAYIFASFMSTVFFTLFAVFYIICLALYLCHSHVRFKLIPVAVWIGVLMTIFDFACVCLAYMTGEVAFNFLDLFLDLVGTILFDAYLIFTPNYMYNYD